MLKVYPRKAHFGNLLTLTSYINKYWIKCIWFLWTLAMLVRIKTRRDRLCLKKLSMLQGDKSTRGHRFCSTWRWDLRRRASQVETLYTRRNSHFDVNIICVPEYFCHPVQQWNFIVALQDLNFGLHFIESLQGFSGDRIMYSKYIN